jgi:hypothetical protein
VDAWWVREIFPLMANREEAFASWRLAWAFGLIALAGNGCTSCCFVREVLVSDQFGAVSEETELRKWWKQPIQKKRDGSHRLYILAAIL